MLYGVSENIDEQEDNGDWNEDELADLGLVDRKRIVDKYAEDRDDDFMNLESTMEEPGLQHMSTVGNSQLFNPLEGGDDLANGFQFEMEEVAVGEEFLAVKPWVGQIKEPSNFRKPANFDKAPQVRLQLDYIHGYRCKDMRNNIFFN